MASPPVGKKKISQSFFLVQHNPLPSFPVKDCDLKQWIMKSQESTSHYTPHQLRLMGEEGKRQIKKKVQFLDFLLFSALLFLGHGSNNHKLAVVLGIPILDMDTRPGQLQAIIPR